MTASLATKDMLTYMGANSDAPGGDEDATIEITDRINFPGFNDEWRCVEGVAAFGAPGEGKVVDLGRATGDETTSRPVQLPRTASPASG